MLTPEQVKKAIAILGAEDGDGALALVTEILASAAAGVEAEVPAEEELADEVPAEETEELAADTEEVEEKSKLAKALKAATGAKSVGEALATLGRVVKQHTALQAQHEALDLSSRRELVGELIKLGVELPSTAWKGLAEKRVPVDRLMSESLDSMRSRIAVLAKQRPKSPAPPVKRNESPSTIDESDDAESVAEQVARLSRKKLDAIKKRGLTPEQFIALRKTAVRRTVG